MTLAIEEPRSRAAVCPSDGMPLFPTIVGLRCPLCGAATRTAASAPRSTRR